MLTINFKCLHSFAIYTSAIESLARSYDWNSLHITIATIQHLKGKLKNVVAEATRILFNGPSKA